MNKGLIGCAGLCALLMGAGLANAQDALKYEMLQQHLDSQPAQLRVVAGDSLKNVKITIADCGPQTVMRSIGSMTSGQIETISWKQPLGRYQCRVDITAQTSLGSAVRAKGTHEYVSTAALSMNIDLRALTPDVSDVMLHTNRPVQNASIKVTAEDGSAIDSVETAVDNQKDIKLSWTPTNKRPAVIEIRVEDGSGAWANSTIVYFQIPHTDIVFDTAKHAVRPDQEKYLQESLDKINEIIARMSQVAVDVYITGHTDTVGSAAANDKLSTARAKAIAMWFRKHGLKVPAYYRGVGERDLAVKTEDETPNEQNRRAVYIISNHAPVDESALGAFNKL